MYCIVVFYVRTCNSLTIHNNYFIPLFSSPSGLLFLRVTRTNQNINNNIGTSSEEAVSVIGRRQEDLLRCQREFIQTSRQWWSHTQKKYPFLQERNVKLLAKDECGHFRFVGSFVNPIKSPRSLINPRFAARFVSLLPLKRDLNMTGISDEAWHCPHAFLSRLEVAGEIARVTKAQPAHDPQPGE